MKKLSIWGTLLLIISVNSNVFSQDVNFSMIGLSKWVSGDIDGAIDAFTKAIEYDAYDHTSYFNRASLKSQNEDWEGAIRDISSAIAIKPRFDYFYFRANAKLFVDDYYGAISDCDKALVMKHSNIENHYPYEVYATRGVSKFGLRKFNEALVDLNKSISLNESDYAYLYRGYTYIELKNKMKGCLDLSRAGELGNDRAYESIKKYCR